MAFTFTDENAKEIIESGKPVMIDFWASWCGPCLALGPVVDKLAGEYDADRIVIGKYNTDEQNELCTEFRVMSLPAVLFFKDGKMVSRLAGLQKEETLRSKIDELLG